MATIHDLARGRRREDVPRIRRHAWAPEVSICLTDVGWWILNAALDGSVPYAFSYDDFTASDWIEVSPPVLPFYNECARG